MPLTTREQEIVDAVEALLDVATSRHHDRHSEDTFIECHLCGEWDGHKNGCPVPLLLKWQDT